jgi:signal transduction histidine kinase
VRYQIPDHIQIRLDAPEALLVHLPECGFRQTLLNLILNAAEALGADPGDISVVVSADGDSVTFVVRDDGPGFAPDLIGQEIRTFRTHRPEGTGLGLAIAQRFVREHGGRLTLSNRPPHGAEVTIAFPPSVWV